ncbi:Stk1 family PASTA domain-containing Ser/Thr kinase [Flexivirga sp. ID2601S]|uniref:non-specific serine/threonine protein kinase n=1 Tax=Flexivirga aerilata TaxID=1656889 RepID=A0A849AEY4_9MICO|nr:Stk1 family PASTA domain-containing Ser/Thr kinase [Flexivirga aerilata]
MLGGRYEVGELIGRGGMAEVHLGHDTRLGRTVAIKMLRVDLARDSSFLTRFRREAQSAAGLSHHSIVAVYDSGEETFTETGGATVDVPYIVMEYVDGQTLREILNEEGKLSPDEAARVTMGILSALEYSHDKGIVHRDIKPANVMLTKGGSVKVMDFGIARALADTGATMTSAQAVVGTARYLSPEQAQGETVDARSDLYSAGCVFYELLTGRTPFVGEPVSLVYQHITDPPKPPSFYEPSVPKAMDAVALRSLEKKRDDRYQTAAAFRGDLQAARTGAPLSEETTALLAGAGAGAGATSMMRRTPPAADPPAPRRRDYTREFDDQDRPARRHTGLWVAAAVVALLAILGIGYLVMNNGSDTTTIRVPSVVQQPQASAERTLKDAGFTDIRVNPVKSSDVSKGYVASTDPTGGTEVNPSSQIVLNVSDGPGLVAVPNVAGKTEQQARDALQQAGFLNVNVGNSDVSDSQYAKGQVASTNPSIGTQADPSQTVSLNLSNGKVHVPGGLVGMDVGDAQSALSDAHLRYRSESVPVNDQSQVGKVLSASPESGSVADVNSTVVLRVGAYAAPTVSVTVTQTPPPQPTPSTQSSSPSPTSSSSAPSSSSPSPTSPSPTSSGKGNGNGNGNGK